MNIKTSQGYLVKLFSTLLLTLLLASCTVTPEPAAIDPELETTATLTLKGNPTFSESKLSSEMRLWHKRLWVAIKRSNTEVSSLAKSGDVYKLGRRFNEHITSLLLAFRATGDLRLLDEIDHKMQLARGTLKDTNRDGYVNWVNLNRNGDLQYYGDDYHKMNEIMTHALVAAVAYAYKANEGLKSPKGVSYKERASFWTNYLERHFEAKWRKRAKKSSGFPFLRTNTNHAYAQWMRYHHYMYKLTGKTAYKSEVERMAKVVLKEYKQINTPSGVAFVFDHVVQAEFDYKRGLQPAVYAKYQTQAATDLHFEGVAPFTTSFMQKLTRTVSHFILDGDPKRSGKPMAVDVGGTINRDTPNQVRTNDGTIIKADLKWLESKRFNRWSNDQYAQGTFTELSAFESNSKIRTASESIYKKVETKPEEPYWVFIPAGTLLRLANR